jgi:hypothetical protein
MTLESAQAALIYLVMVYGGGLIAWGVWQLAGRIRRGTGPVARSLIGRPKPPPWVQDHWGCGRCRTVNPRFAERCQGCRQPRSAVEIAVPPPAAVPDVVPTEIQASGALVRLEHNAIAHDDGLAGHWRLRVNGVIAGSAANRDGALELLRALRDAETVYYDPAGGVGPYPLAALIGAFEAGPLAVAGACPERATRG